MLQFLQTCSDFAKRPTSESFKNNSNLFLRFILSFMFFTLLHHILCELFVPSCFSHTLYQSETLMIDWINHHTICNIKTNTWSFLFECHNHLSLIFPESLTLDMDMNTDVASPMWDGFAQISRATFSLSLLAVSAMWRERGREGDRQTSLFLFTYRSQIGATLCVRNSFH